MALPDRPLKADRGARPSRVRLGLRRRRAAADQSSNACNSRLPSFARSAILLPQPRPQCIARPDDTAHRGPRAARTLRFPTATGRRCACAVPSLTWPGTVGGGVSVRCRFCCSGRPVWAASPWADSLWGPLWPDRALLPAHRMYRDGRSGASCSRVSLPCAALSSAPSCGCGAQADRP